MAKKDNIVPINAPKAEPKSIKILSENAQLKHINQRHEGSGEEPVLALDLKFECIVRGDLLQALCGSETNPDFWNEDGSVKYLGITNFTSRAELKECDFEFGDLIEEPIKISGVKANKFTFTPVGGHWGQVITPRAATAYRCRAAGLDACHQENLPTVHHQQSGCIAE